MRRSLAAGQEQTATNYYGALAQSHRQQMERAQIANQSGQLGYSQSRWQPQPQQALPSLIHPDRIPQTSTNLQIQQPSPALNHSQPHTSVVPAHLRHFFPLTPQMQFLLAQVAPILQNLPSGQPPPVQPQVQSFHTSEGQEAPSTDAAVPHEVNRSSETLSSPYH